MKKQAPYQSTSQTYSHRAQGAQGQERQLFKGQGYEFKLDSDGRRHIQVPYKQKHQILPLLILPDHRLLVDTECALYKKIYPHLISISEPIYRPKHYHEYKITKFSLYTAMVLHYTSAQIIAILSKISKNKVFPVSLENQIREYMRYAGEVIFYLKEGIYHLITTRQIGFLLEGYLEFVGQVEIDMMEEEYLSEINKQLEEEIQNAKQRKKVMREYKIIGDYFQVTKKLINHNIPLVQQFDFIHDQNCPGIQIEMIKDIQLKYYQERALRNIFIQNKARSGIIILPCGAGKSLVAIAALQRVKKKTIVFCQSQVSAEQWRQEILKWTTLPRDKIIVFSPKWRDKNAKKILQCSLFITTYTMVGMKRAVENQFLSISQQISWGLCIADEVHKLPADTFQLVLQKYKFHMKLGLTATPYRQDQKISNLFFMIGPKLFEQNWLDLVNQGCLAKPYCVEILCEMQESFMQAYQKTNYSQLIHTANPTKFTVLQYLLKKHLYCQDKILVFCDRPKIIEEYARRLRYPFIHGEVSEEERVKIYNLFKTTRDINVLFLSRVGDTAIDLPCANVAIQIGMHYKSRRQEVQRMGRIMRAKQNPSNQYNAFFYTLVSMNTRQVSYCRTRQKCLVDQGFEYEIKMSKALSFKGMNMVPLDPKEFLFKLLVEHDEGDKFINQEQIRKPTQIKLVSTLTDQYYYQEND